MSEVMLKTYEMKEYRVTINYHTQRTNLVKVYEAYGYTEDTAIKLCLGALLLEEVRRYIKFDSVVVEEI